VSDKFEVENFEDCSLFIVSGFYWEKCVDFC
jgi:hypothetical protein